MSKQCCICYDDIVDCAVTPCGHVFCYNCIKEWLSRTENCPICKSQITLDQIVRVNKSRTQKIQTDESPQTESNLKIKLISKIIFFLSFPFLILLIVRFLINSQ